MPAFAESNRQPRLAETVTKAKTVQNSGDAIQSAAKEFKEDIDRRVKEVLALLRLDVEQRDARLRIVAPGCTSSTRIP